VHNGDFDSDVTFYMTIDICDYFYNYYVDMYAGDMQSRLIPFWWKKSGVDNDM